MHLKHAAKEDTMRDDLDYQAVGKRLNVLSKNTEIINETFTPLGITAISAGFTYTASNYAAYEDKFYCAIELATLPDSDPVARFTLAVNLYDNWGSILCQKTKKVSKFPGYGIIKFDCSADDGRYAMEVATSARVYVISAE